MKRIPIVGFSKKFKRIKLPAQKVPKFKRDPGDEAIKQFTKKFGDKPQFMGFSERAGVSMAAESLASKTAERSFIKTLMGGRKRVGSTASALGRSRTKTAVGVKSIKPVKLKIFKAKQKGAMKAYGVASKKSDVVFTRTLEKFSGKTKRSPFKTVSRPVNKLSKAGHDSREFQYIKKVKDEWGF